MFNRKRKHQSSAVAMLITAIISISIALIVLSAPNVAHPQTATQTHSSGTTVGSTAVPLLISTQRLILKNGSGSALPTVMTAGQVYLANDTGTLYFGTPNGTIYAITATTQASSGSSSFTSTPTSSASMPTFAIGNVTAVPTGGTATAAIRGTSPNFILDLGVVSGNAGMMGATGATGAASTVAGPVGPMGATGAASTVPGPAGPVGATGAASTVPGPTGPAGPPSTVPGPVGPTGAAGAASTVAGPQGVQGIQGISGSVGATGPTGPVGPASTVAGPQGIQGIAGANGTNALPLFRATSVAVPASTLNVATNVSVTWSSAFADSNYRVAVTTVTSSGITLNVATSIVGKTTTGVTIRETVTTLGTGITTLTAGSATLDVVAIHDQ